MIEDEAEIGLDSSLILEDIFDLFLIDFGIDLGSEIGPKWVGNRIGMVIGKRRAQEGFMRANLGSKMGSCWIENRRRWGSKSRMETRSVKKRGEAVWRTKV